MEVVAHVPGQIDDIHTFRFKDGLIGRYVPVELHGSTVLHLCEVQVFAILSKIMFYNLLNSCYPDVSV